MDNRNRLSILLVSLITASSLGAMEFTPMGSKAVSMGGAGVASADSSIAGYYNPALLGKAKLTFSMELGIGAGVRDNGAGESAQNLNDSGFTDAYTRLNENPTGSYPSKERDIKTVIDSSQIVLDMNGDHVLVNPDAYLGFQFSNFGLGIYAKGEAVAEAIVSQDHTALIVGNDIDGYYDIENDTLSNKSDYESTSMIYAVENEETYMDATALALLEIPMSYGHNFVTDVGDISIGVSLKFMQGTTYRGKVSIDVESDEIQDDLENSETTTSTFGIDLGLLYTPTFAEGLRFGLVGKNLNSPEFDVIDESVYTLDPMVRFGVAYDIFDSLEIAVDYDITKNETIIPEFEVQYLGGGLSYHPFTWFSIRGGLMDNLESDLEGVIYTGGLALGPQWLQFDISGQYASEEETVDGTTYPTYARVNFAISSKW